MSIFESTYGLTEREQKALDRSWSKIFAEDVFPYIDEERFSVLYSEKASRPNTPVNVIVGALIIKELFGISDDEIVDNLMLDPRYQLALHTSSYQEQPSVIRVCPGSGCAAITMSRRKALTCIMIVLSALPMLLQR